MAFSMFYGIFSLMLLFHMQRVVNTDRIHKNKGHGGYGYGSDSAAWGARNDMYNLLCFYCQMHPDYPCNNRFCQASGFIGYAGRIGVFGYEWYNPHPLEVLCYYCRYYRNIPCQLNFGCWR